MKRQREEEEREREENGEGDGVGENGGWNQEEAQSYFMNGQGAAGYDNSYLMQQYNQQQQMMGGFGNQWMSPSKFGGYDPRFEEGPDSAMRLQSSNRAARAKLAEVASRN